MGIEKKYKIILKKTSGTSSIEITRHKDPIMNNILIVNSIGRSKRYKDTWVIEKDLESWMNLLKLEGYTEIKKIGDAKISQKNNKKI